MMKTRMLTLAATGLVLGLLQMQAYGDDVMTQQEVRDGYKRHAALTQLHRWYQLYENKAVPIENQLDILAKDVRLMSALGEGVGHDVYRERVKKIPATWANAHRVNSAEFTFDDDNTSMNVEITYWNTGILEDGEVHSAELSYTTTLESSDSSVLPTFTSINIGQNGEGKAEEFVDYYPENRLKSLMHYWLTLIENPARDPEPVREILDENFALNFSSGAITEFDQFKTWLAGPGSQVEASTHEPDQFSYQVIADGQYEMKVDFAWQGITPDGKEMSAKTRHTWAVTDQPTDRFAKIQTMDVEVLEPFAAMSK